MFAATEQDCLHVLSGAFHELPAPASTEWTHFETQLQRDFAANNGYAVLDTSKYVLSEYGDAFYKSMPHNWPGQITNNELKVFNRPDSYFSMPAEPQQTMALRRLTDWIRELVAASLGDANVRNLVSVELRLSTAEGVFIKFERWHVDGYGINVIVPLKGTGTEILGSSPASAAAYRYHPEQGEEWEKTLGTKNFQRLQLGHTLVFTGSQFPTPTVHRTPPDLQEERLLLLMRFSR